LQIELVPLLLHLRDYSSFRGNFRDRKLSPRDRNVHFKTENIN
jgi:hypothetical protein